MMIYVHINMIANAESVEKAEIQEIEKLYIKKHLISKKF